jgi:hypothetical protein
MQVTNIKLDYLHIPDLILKLDVFLRFYRSCFNTGNTNYTSTVASVGYTTVHRCA